MKIKILIIIAIYAYMRNLMKVLLRTGTFLEIGRAHV